MSVKTVSLEEVVPAINSASEFIVEDKAGNIEVITRDQIRQKDPDQIVSATPKPFQREIIDGANTTEEYLSKEFPLMLKFFKERGISNPKVTYDVTKAGEKWLRVDFPLPKQCIMENGHIYTPAYDKEAIIFVLNHYPDMPPIGFFVTKQSKNIAFFNQVFESHKYDEAILEEDSVSKALKNDWYWICFHYSGNQWKFNRNNIMEGDSLTYFMYYLYYRMKGIKGVSSEQ